MSMTRRTAATIATATTVFVLGPWSAVAPAQNAGTAQYVDVPPGGAVAPQSLTSTPSPAPTPDATVLPDAGSEPDDAVVAPIAAEGETQVAPRPVPLAAADPSEELPFTGGQPLLIGALGAGLLALGLGLLAVLRTRSRRTVA